MERGRIDRIFARQRIAPAASAVSRRRGNSRYQAGYIRRRNLPLLAQILPRRASPALYRRESRPGKERNLRSGARLNEPASGDEKRVARRLGGRLPPVSAAGNALR